MFFVQMSGFPGSGKSTLSRQIAERTGAIMIDHDIVKTALLQSIEEIQIDSKLTGKISYNIDWSLIEFHLSQGQNVVFDSPCLYQEMVDKGIALSKKYDAKYKYVECYLDDFQEINFRLKSRERMMSQISEASEENFKYTLVNSKRPANYEFIVVNTSEPIDSYINEVLHYIKK